MYVHKYVVYMHAYRSIYSNCDYYCIAVDCGPILFVYWVYSLGIGYMPTLAYAIGYSLQFTLCKVKVVSLSSFSISLERIRDYNSFTVRPV